MTQTHTLANVEKALVTAEDLLVQGLDLGERDVDLIGLLQNAVLTALEDSATSLDDVIRTHYSETPDQIREWWSGWS
jgi:hypothetical protein